LIRKKGKLSHFNHTLTQASKLEPINNLKGKMGTPKPCSQYLIGPRDHSLSTFVFINALRKITYRSMF